MTQPTALFLADVLEDAGKPADIAEKCAAELRRLYAQRDALLNALRKYVYLHEDCACEDCAAIKAVEENI